MGGYEKYVGRIKAVKADINYDLAYRRIQEKERRIYRMRAGLSLAGASLIFLTVFAAYAGLDWAGDRQDIITYLREGGAVNGSPSMDYVFGD